MTLMIVRSIRVRYQDGRLPTGRQFRQRTGSGPTQDQVGPAVALSHIVQKRQDLRLQTCLDIGLGYRRSISQATGNMPNTMPTSGAMT